MPGPRGCAASSMFHTACSSQSLHSCIIYVNLTSTLLPILYNSSSPIPDIAAIRTHDVQGQATSAAAKPIRDMLSGCMAVRMLRQCSALAIGLRHMASVHSSIAAPARHTTTVCDHAYHESVRLLLLCSPCAENVAI